MVYKEKIFIIGGTGNVGQALVRSLLANPNVALTLYARSPAKLQELFGEQTDEKVQVIQGDYVNQKPFEQAIPGHTRLFLLLQVPDFDYSNIARGFAEKAYDAGVKQIVINSGITASMPWRSTTYSGVPFEKAVLDIPNRKAVVTLRPANFMSNQLMPGGDADNAKKSNMIFDTREPDQPNPWISPNDIGELAANILQEPIEKHGDAVYEMIGDPRTPTEHAEILSRVLGKTITYQKISEEQLYEAMTKQGGLAHTVAYLYVYFGQYTSKRTPGLSILLGRQPETLEQWIVKNKSAFS
ncbi:hypothetical protein INT45_006395 [Circinella minor]|uniref:NmrA-like domain-containing protein n=1 Tax=Circinella minor TaxID=1195481 RepID=A0A8H7VSC3_9FUNG|nr:hypothetical protein INT45_006395 [Circinella minor]